MAAIEQPTSTHDPAQAPLRLDTVDARMVALMRCGLVFAGTTGVAGLISPIPPP